MRGEEESGRLWEAQSVVFYMSGGPLEAQSVVFFTLRAVPPTQFNFNRVPFCDGFTPRLADRRGLAPSALEPISDPETISEAVWIADAVLVLGAAILVNFMGIEALQTLQLFISRTLSTKVRQKCAPLSRKSTSN